MSVAFGSQVAPSTRVGARGFAEWLIVIAVFFPMGIHSVVSQYAVFPVLAIVYALLCAGAAAQVADSPLYVGFLLLYASFAAVLLAWLPTVIEGDLVLGTISTIFVIWPAAIAAVAWTPDIERLRLNLGRAWLVCAFVSVPLAIHEYLDETRVFDSRITPDLSRAAVGQEHPIVLGALFCAAIPMLIPFRLRWRLLGVAVLMVGILTTGSSGPLIVGVTVALITLFGSRFRQGQHGARIMGAALFGAIIWAALQALETWSAQLSDRSLDDYNFQYRLALYSLLPKMLSAAPFGWGLNGLPKGTYYIHSTWRGSMDVSDTLDSEIVFLATKFGVIGILICIVALVVAIRALRVDAVLSLAFLALLVNGASVALHAWPGVALATGFLFAMCWRAVRESRSGDGNRSARRRSVGVGLTAAAAGSEKGHLRPKSYPTIR